MFAVINDKNKFIESAKRLAKQYGWLSNVYRVFILTYLIKNGGASWFELKLFIESLVGKINPNTLHFHLYALVDAGIVKVYGNPEKPGYKLNDKKKGMLESIKPLQKYLFYKNETTSKK